MGQRIIALAAADAGFQVAAAVEAASHPRLGDDAGLLAGVGSLGVPLASELRAGADVVVDFSTPQGAATVVETCLRLGVPLVLATTGLNAQQGRQVALAAQSIAILQAPSMSLAVNLTMKLATLAAEVLARHPTRADVEIIERHHRFKKDSPSGTALHFAKVIQEAMGEMPLRHGREGQVGERPAKEIGMHAVRSGDNVGEHTILFSTLGETMELVHKGHTRDAYVRGALQAAKFLATKGPGRYSMSDVLGL
jgi:4-hydroxy-tetrahydrodipicolinate reductase